MSAGADLFWDQSELFFARWQRLARSRPARVRRECLVYLRWITRLEARDPDSAVIAEVLREIVIEIMIDLSP